MYKVLSPLKIVAPVLAIATLCSCALISAKKPEIVPSSQRQRTLLDANWQFHRGDISSSNDVIAPDFDDAQWQAVHLPHDYVLDGTYANSTNKVVRGHAYLPYEVAWYRKHFSVPESSRGKILRLDFDGIFRDGQVWLNGQFLGEHQSGYTPFSFDITRLVKPDGDNVLTVRVDPREFEGWWYEGGGIYRHVWLTALAPVHIAQFGTYVTSKVPNGDQGADEQADITIRTTLENAGESSARGELISEILDPRGHVLQTLRQPASVDSDGRQEITQNTVIPHPKLWSVESPNLYRLRTTVLQDGKPADATVTTFGIRTIRYDAEKGFFLNGKHVEIQGVACHQDYPAVGIAVPDSLQPWRVAQLKKLGCNGWRTAHNPANETVLDACDRQGMLVMDENRHLGDTWDVKTGEGTTATNLSDLATMILRDRNHPSIIMWSLCNEEAHQDSEEGVRITSAMIDLVHRYDTTRPCTSAVVHHWPDNRAGAVLEIVGVNYNDNKYDAIHKKYPGKPLYGSEATNLKTTRGEYKDDPATGMCSAYNLSNKAWLSVVNRPFMCGSYTWTGFDYKGEPNPYGWPDVSNNTGLLDCCGFPKDKAFYFESCWSDKPMVHLLPDSWNWQDRKGKAIRVIAFSNARQVELFLNGKSLGTKDVPHDDMAEWQVPWQPGRLVATARTEGKTVATEVLDTTGAPAKIVLAADRRLLHTDGEDTVVVPVTILDSKGRVVPDSSNRITFHLSGGGQFVGTGNGNPADHDPDRADNRKVFHGRCVAVLQAGTEPASLTLTATSPGLVPAEIHFTVR